MGKNEKKEGEEEGGGGRGEKGRARLRELLASYFTDGELRNHLGSAATAQAQERLVGGDGRKGKLKQPTKDAWRRLCNEGNLPLRFLADFKRVRALLRLLDPPGTADSHGAPRPALSPAEAADRLAAAVRDHCTSFLELHTLEELLEGRTDESALLANARGSLWLRRRVTHAGTASIVDGAASGDYAIECYNLPDGLTPLDLTALLLPHASAGGPPCPPRRISNLGRGRYEVILENPGAALGVLAADLSLQGDPVHVGLPGTITSSLPLPPTPPDWSAILTVDYEPDRITLFRLSSEADEPPPSRMDLERWLSRFGRTVGVAYRAGDPWGAVRWANSAMSAMKAVRTAAGNREPETPGAEAEIEFGFGGRTVAFARPVEGEQKLWWAVARARERAKAKNEVPGHAPAATKKKGGKRVLSDDESDWEMDGPPAERPATPKAHKGHAGGKGARPNGKPRSAGSDLDGDGKCPDPHPGQQANSDRLGPEDVTASLLAYFSDPGHNRTARKKKRKIKAKKRRVGGDPGGLVSLFTGLDVSGGNAQSRSSDFAAPFAAPVEEEEGWVTEDDDKRAAAAHTVR